MSPDLLCRNTAVHPRRLSERIGEPERETERTLLQIVMGFVVLHAIEPIPAVDEPSHNCPLWIEIVSQADTCIQAIPAKLRLPGPCQPLVFRPGVIYVDPGKTSAEEDVRPEFTVRHDIDLQIQIEHAIGGIVVAGDDPACIVGGSLVTDLQREPVKPPADEQAEACTIVQIRDIDLLLVRCPIRMKRSWYRQNPRSMAL